VDRLPEGQPQLDWRNSSFPLLREMYRDPAQMLAQAVYLLKTRNVRHDVVVEQLLLLLVRIMHVRGHDHPCLPLLQLMVRRVLLFAHRRRRHVPKPPLLHHLKPPPHPPHSHQPQQPLPAVSRILHDSKHDNLHRLQACPPKISHAKICTMHWALHRNLHNYSTCYSWTWDRMPMH